MTKAVTEKTTSPYFPGAESWYIRAAREALPAKHFPDLDDMEPGGVGMSLLHAEQDGRVTVWIAVDTGRTTYYERPRRGTAAEERWLAARDDIANTLMDAGFYDIVRTKAGLLATAPSPTQATRLLVQRENIFEGGTLGRHHVTAPEHPHLHGRLDNAHGIGPEVSTYVYAREDDEQPVWPRGFSSLHHAAEAWALHCGLPTPIEVTYQEATHD